MGDKFVPKYKINARDQEYVDEMIRKEQMFVITDPKLPDHPIVFASDMFCKFTVYPREEIVGRNCRFLQGKGTTDADIEKIRRSLKDGIDTSVGLINYKSGGEQFFMTTLRSKPSIFNKEGRIRYFIGVQYESDATSYKAILGELLQNYGKLFREKQLANSKK